MSIIDCRGGGLTLYIVEKIEKDDSGGQMSHTYKTKNKPERQRYHQHRCS